MADRPVVVAEMWIAAPPDLVWGLVTDVSRMGDWSPENDGGSWLDGATGPAPGARFRSENHRGERTWQTTSTVTVSEPGKRFAYAVNEPEDPAATWSFDLASEGDGTRVVQRVGLGPGPSGLQSAIDKYPDREAEIVARRMSDLWQAMHETLGAIKAEAES